MPEGDTIFRTARTLGRALAGKPIVGFRSAYPKLTRYDDDTQFAGQIVNHVEARGKWLLIHFSGGYSIFYSALYRRNAERSGVLTRIPHKLRSGRSAGFQTGCRASLQTRTRSPRNQICRLETGYLIARLVSPG